MSRRPSRRSGRVPAALLFISSLLLAGCGGGDAASSGGEPDPLFTPLELAAADRAFERREFEAARGRFAIYLETHPRSSWVGHILCRIGECYLAEGNLSRAEQFFFRCLKFEPPSDVWGRAVVGLGDVNYRRGKHVEAFRKYWQVWDEDNLGVRADVPEAHVLFHMGKGCWALGYAYGADHYFALLIDRHRSHPFAVAAAELHRPPYEVHAGAFEKREEAAGRARKGRAQNLNAEIIAFERDGGFWLRVRVGIFRTRPEAEKVANELRRLEIDGFVKEEPY